MSMNKRLQIPVSPSDEKLFKSAAKVYQISAAEWARRVLRTAAQNDTPSDLKLSPSEALKRLSLLSAPVSDIDQMITESTKGRLS